MPEPVEELDRQQLVRCIARFHEARSIQRRQHSPAVQEILGVTFHLSHRLHGRAAPTPNTVWAAASRPAHTVSARPPPGPWLQAPAGPRGTTFEGSERLQGL